MQKYNSDTIVEMSLLMVLNQRVRNDNDHELRMVYLLDWQGKSDAGVVQKMKDQIIAWRNQGVIVEVVLITKDINLKSYFDSNTYTFLYMNSWERYLSRKKAMRFILENKIEWIIYRRYSLMIPIEINSMRKLNTIIELNTNNSFFYRERGLVQYLWYKSQNSKIGKWAMGACSVTEEIKKQNDLNFRNISVFTNATRIDQFSPLPIPRKSHKLLFLAGGDYQWNGIEFLKAVAIALPEYQIDIYGLPKNSATESNMKFCNYIDPVKIRTIIPEYLAGITTLQLENIGLTEAAPLKTRHYLANGLPVIGRFKDSGISDESRNYFLLDMDLETMKIKNHRELIDFLNYCEGHAINKSDLQEIDVAFVEKRRVQFFRELRA